jgi:hypothetical protein
MATDSRTRKRQYENAVKRETYLNKVDRPVKENVSKKPKTGVIYASSLIKKGDPGVSQEFIIQGSERAIAFFGGVAALGLKSEASATDPLPATPRFWVPAKVHAGVGLGTPTAKRSPWGSRVVKSKSATYSAPISATVANVTFDSLQTRAKTIFTAIKANLGDESYSSFYLSPETYNNKIQG